MDIRDATDDDIDEIRTIARESLSSRYTDFLAEETVDEAIEQRYGDAIEQRLHDDRTVFLVVERDDGVVAFSECLLVGKPYTVGQILWLHVHPAHHGDGIGVRLLVRTREQLLENGADQVRGFVLEENEGGNRFYADHGFEQADQREVGIGSQTYTENIYVEAEPDDGDEWEAIDRITVDDEPLYVNYGEAARGSNSPFYSAYDDDSLQKRVGWYCGHCDSIDTAMDPMGRIECNGCGNRRKATRWDASYL